MKIGLNLGNPGIPMTQKKSPALKPAETDSVSFGATIQLKLPNFLKQTLKK